MHPNVELIQGDITQQDTDAIVNAANSSLLGGGGVDGAIHRAGGPKILAQCKKIFAHQGRCPTGQAVITTAGNLKARFVIHAVGPVYRDGHHGENQLLAEAYLNSLELAQQNHLESIAFPSISTGAYRFPIEKAAHIALHTVHQFLNSQNQLDLVRFVLFSSNDLEIYQNTAREIQL